MLRAALLLCLFAGVFAETVHWQWRELVCKSKDEKNNKEASDCEVLLKETENDQNGRKVPLNTCFDEETQMGNPDVTVTFSAPVLRPRTVSQGILRTTENVSHI
ncbi:hypothetical protein COOONC_14646 [Cooperia oncophora]